MPIYKKIVKQQLTVLVLILAIVMLGCTTGVEENEDMENNNNKDIELEEDADIQEKVGENDEGEETIKTTPESTNIEFVNIQTDDWEVDTLAENLVIPWSITTEEGVFYLSERGGHIVTIDNGEYKRTELETTMPIAHQGEGGLLGFVLAEDFSESGEAFGYYTFANEAGVLKNRMVLIEQREERWLEKKVLLDDIPGAGIHNGGRLAIGPDGLLYATVGDANVPDLSQDVSNLAGSIIRITTTGEIPANNPFDESYLYSFGHRNPQGLAWNEQGDLYSSEHGPRAQDEINVIQAAYNYGWPVIEGAQSQEGMEQPLIHSGTDTWAPSGITFWNDNLFVAGLRGESLYYVDEDGGDLVAVFKDEGRLRDVTSDGEALYVITNNRDGRGNPGNDDDRLLKLTLRENE